MADILKVEFEKPEIPEDWNYNESVKKVKGFIYKAKNLTEDILKELYIAREILSSQGRRTDLTSLQMQQSWNDYCQEIGVNRTTIHRWLNRYLEKTKSEAPQLPECLDKYRVVYADPPWRYADKLVEGYGAADHHYPSMAIEELCSLKVNELAAKDSILFLWVTSPILEECFEVIKAWGFEYKASFVWDKIKHNYGHYNSMRHEFLLICTRGSYLPETKKLFDSVVSIERKKHSEKPEEFRKMIDELYPSGKRIELFARKNVENWDSWGNETDG